MNLKKSFHLISFITGPLLFIILPFLLPGGFISAGANQSIAIAAWMIIWWVTEAVPVSVTALLPLILFPFLGLMTFPEAATPYANPIIFLFMGGFLIAIALEKHRLHERIALNLIQVTGTSGNGIILGFMIATGALSMWISNTATAMMMLPIANSVINLVRKNPEQRIEHMEKRERNFALSLMLMVGYAATLGGLATIIGSPPNVVFKGLLQEYHNESLSFGKWMLVGVPVALTTLLCTYFILTLVLYPNKIKTVEGSDELLKGKLLELGRISTAEKIVLIIFMFTSLLWITQEPLNQFVFGKKILNDANIAMLGGILMFVVPSDVKEFQFVLTWKDTERLQWGILLLFGGGLCLAHGLEKTGIIETIGKALAFQNSYNYLLVLLLIVATVFLSELMSNVALVQIFIPVIFGISTALDINPILLAMPVTLSASIGFMFPIATPPNAIVYSSGYIRMKEMVKAGIVLDICCILIIFIASVTLVNWLFG